MQNKWLFLPVLLAVQTLSCNTSTSAPPRTNGPAQEHSGTYEEHADPASGNSQYDDEHIGWSDYDIYGRPTRIGVRDFLVRGQAEREGFGAYAYLILRRGSKNQERHRRVCEAFTMLLEADEYNGEVAPQQLMVTFWPLKEAVTDRSCSKLVENYDFKFSTRVASALGMAGVEGPVLVAWPKPFATRGAGAQVLVFDLTTYSDVNLERAFTVWQGQISRDPEYWADGWKLVQIRETLRNVLDAGARIVLAIMVK